MPLPTLCPPTLTATPFGRCPAFAPLTPTPAHLASCLPAVIVESTYGVSRHPPRELREADFLLKIHETLRRGGRVLLPVVALGRAQVCRMAG